MKKLSKKADFDSLPVFLDFIRESSEKAGIDTEGVSDIILSSEEILVNIISYAYKGGAGDVEIVCYPTDENRGICITFIDNGIPFNTLEASEPDLSLPLEDRKIGGLGIHIVKNLMNEVKYDRTDGKNILTIVKNASV